MLIGMMRDDDYDDSLTQFNRNLFLKSRVFARENGYKFVWFKDS